MARRKKMNWLSNGTDILLIAGAINWGLLPFGFNLVQTVLQIPLLINVVYLLVGISGVMKLYELLK